MIPTAATMANKDAERAVQEYSKISEQAAKPTPMAPTVSKNLTHLDLMRLSSSISVEQNAAKAMVLVKSP